MKYCLIFTQFDDKDAMNILEINYYQYQSAIVSGKLSYGLCSEYRTCYRYQWHNFFDLVVYALHTLEGFGNLLSGLEVTIDEVVDIFALCLENISLNDDNLATKFARYLSSELDCPTVVGSDEIAERMCECALRIHQKIVEILSAELKSEVARFV